MSLVIRSGLSFLKPTIPPGYVPLKYIRSTGTQYIDTGITPSNDMEFEIEYQSLATGNTKLYGCESYAGSLFDAFAVRKTKAEIRAFAHSTGGGVVTNIKTIEGQKNALRLVIKNGTNSIYVNGELVATSPTNGIIPNRSIFLFASNRHNIGADGKGPQIIYGCRIKKSEKLVGDFRPFLNADFIAGMYDMVGGEFHGNLGTGEFITQFSSTETASVMSLEMNDDVDFTNENYDGGVE